MVGGISLIWAIPTDTILAGADTGDQRQGAPGVTGRTRNAGGASLQPNLSFPLEEPETMPEITNHAPGTFCWIDLASTDAQASKNFYAELMGWAFHDEPMGEDAFYTLLQKDGKNVGGLYQMDAGMLEQGIPPHWNSYIAVENADDGVAKVTAAGGAVLMEPGDVMGAGRMAVVADPAGAAVCLWQPLEHLGADIVGEPGCAGLERTPHQRCFRRRRLLPAGLRMGPGRSRHGRRPPLQRV